MKGPKQIRTKENKYDLTKVPTRNSFYFLLLTLHYLSIQEATAMNPDMQVEKIEIQQEVIPQ